MSLIFLLMDSTHYLLTSSEFQLIIKSILKKMCQHYQLFFVWIADNLLFIPYLNLYNLNTSYQLVCRMMDDGLYIYQCCSLIWVRHSLISIVQHIPKFMKWLKYLSFMYYGFRLLLKVQYSGDQLYDCESKGGCKTLQSSPTFGIVNLKGGKKQVWILLAMALVFRLLAYLCLRRRIDHSN